MQFTTLIISALAATAFAYPTNDKPGNGGGGGGGGNGNYQACANNGALYSSAQCCATDVLGVADLDCASPPKVPNSAQDFQQVCSDIGQRPRCCILPVLGQGILCQTPVGLD